MMSHKPALAVKWAGISSAFPILLMSFLADTGPYRVTGLTQAYGQSRGEEESRANTIPDVKAARSRRSTSVERVRRERRDLNRAGSQSPSCAPPAHGYTISKVLRCSTVIPQNIMSPLMQYPFTSTLTPYCRRTAAAAPCAARRPQSSSLLRPPPTRLGFLTWSAVTFGGPFRSASVSAASALRRCCAFSNSAAVFSSAGLNYEVAGTREVSAHSVWGGVDTCGVCTTAIRGGHVQSEPPMTWRARHYGIMTTSVRHITPGANGPWEHAL